VPSEPLATAVRPAGRRLRPLPHLRAHHVPPGPVHPGQVRAHPHPLEASVRSERKPDHCLTRWHPINSIFELLGSWFCPEVALNWLFPYPLITPFSLSLLPLLPTRAAAFFPLAPSTTSSQGLTPKDPECTWAARDVCARTQLAQTPTNRAHPQRTRRTTSNPSSRRLNEAWFDGWGPALESTESAGSHKRVTLRKGEGAACSVRSRLTVLSVCHRPVLQVEAVLPRGRAGMPSHPQKRSSPPLPLNPKVNTKCTTPSLDLVPTVNGKTVRSFPTHGQQSSPRKLDHGLTR
jgi:hypothetical protein